MTDSQLAIDESRYEELFQVEDGAERTGSGIVEDPYPTWAALLAKGPVHPGTLAECMGMPPECSPYVPGRTYFSVFSFAAASEVFTRRDDFSSEFYIGFGLLEKVGDSILSMEGLRHRRYRDLIQPYFQPTFAETWWKETFITPLVNELIDNFANERSVDLNGRFFARLPMHTVTAGFGMPGEDGLEFRRHMMTAFTFGLSPEETAEAAQEAGRIAAKTIRQRQQEPKDDLISKLAHADLVEEDGSTRKLTVEEIASYCRLAVFAGGETTWRQLGIATFALLSHPEQMEEVRKDRSLLSNAILESTRWYPDPLFLRQVKRDTVLQGVELPKDAVLHLCLGAANRDPSRWENPDKFDIHRPVQRSLAFAAGAHSCLGQHVARQEIMTAINALLDRFPNIRWDPAKAPPKLTGGLVHRGPGPLHVLLH